MNHNWSATKQCLRPQSVAEISHHSVLSGDRILQCGTSSGSRHKDTDQCLQVPISFCRHCSVPVPCKNASVKETTVAEGGHNPVANKYLWTDPRRLHNFYYILWHSVWILDRFRPKFNVIIDLTTINCQSFMKLLSLITNINRHSKTNQCVDGYNHSEVKSIKGRLIHLSQSRWQSCGSIR